MKKRIMLFAAVMMIALSSCSANPKVKAPETLFNKENAIVDTGKKDFKANSAIETVKDMKTGWNLGNTLDATGTKRITSETSWGQPKTTKAMIDGLAASGMKTIRIPTSWHNHIIDSNYTIDPKWMARVKEIVDWAIENDMYVILNSHHDNHSSPSAMKKGSGYYPNSTNYEESKAFLENIWSQICLAFNNGYDEHLVFETMNEPRLCGTGHEWWFDPNASECKDAAENLNKLNQVVVNTIRSSGGNNEKRFIACPGLQASPDSALADAFKMPEDIEKGRLIVSVHMYSPYKFAMESPGAKDYTTQMSRENAATFKRLADKFVANGYPVYIGEYGATNKNNLEARTAWFHDFIKFTKAHGIPCILWDNAVWKVSGNDYNEHFGYYDRNNQSWYFPEILDAIMEEANN
ncbi:MAG: glycoside hydrolase family 5 protein [Treponema sp.]|nr:glycoside hydrolase family 5 protein [Treponema sp.]